MRSLRARPADCAHYVHYVLADVRTRTYASATAAAYACNDLYDAVRLSEPALCSINFRNEFILVAFARSRGKTFALIRSESRALT